MLVRGVVGNVIEQDADVSSVSRFDEPIQVVSGPEERMHVGVVRDVVAEIRHGRREDGRNPDGLDAKPLQIVQAAQDADQITRAVAIAVHERARVDLVDDAALPPEEGGHYVLSIFMSRMSS